MSDVLSADSDDLVKWDVRSKDSKGFWKRSTMDVHEGGRPAVHDAVLQWSDASEESAPEAAQEAASWGCPPWGCPPASDGPPASSGRSRP
uniref:Uncharacterized protein n=1 Tax=Zooxanthella nutricula TaxID=1333877 RepID=A0A7S2JLT4_9DINO